MTDETRTAIQIVIAITCVLGGMLILTWLVPVVLTWIGQIINAVYPL